MNIFILNDYDLFERLKTFCMQNKNKRTNCNDS